MRAERGSMNNPWGKLTGIRPAKIATKLLARGMTDERVIDYFMTECGTEYQKAALALKCARALVPVREKMYENGVSLYIGIPFCPSRCLYCSFVTNGTKQAAKLKPDYVEALKKEIAYTAEIVKENKNTVETVYIGGGTPTSLSAELMDDMLTCLENEFDLSHVREFTVEAGRPDTIDREKLDVMKRHGVSRISINPQSMNDETLHVIGRAHSAQDIRVAMALARERGFDDINMDVIAGLPGESLDMFKYTLEEVEKLKPTDTTVHVMSIKRSSRLNEYLSDYDLTDGGTVSKMVDYACEFLASKGKRPYYMYRQKNQLGNLENVGYALPGYESLYNLYIMEEIQTIISMGCGGVTKTVDRETDRIERIFNVKEPKDYILRIDEMLHRKDILRGEVPDFRHRISEFKREL